MTTPTKEQIKELCLHLCFNWENDFPYVTQPEDKGLVLDDVLENDLSYEEKAKALTASYCGAILSDTLSRKRKSMVFNPYNNKLNTEKSASLGTNPQCQTSKCGQVVIKPIQLVGRGQAQRVYDVRGKSICLSANGWGGGAKTRLYRINLPDGQYTVRKLTTIECERLQTLPDNYTECISNTQRYKCIGNGWTVDVITHIFGFIKHKNISAECIKI